MTFDINNRTSLKYDPQYFDLLDKNNQRIYDFTLQPNLLNVQKDDQRNHYLDMLEVKGIMQNGNNDVNGLFIDDSTKMRNGTMSELEGKKELKTRVFIGAPLMSTGQSVLKNPDLSSRLSRSEDTRVKKSASSLSGMSVDNFIPLVPNIANNIQDPSHIIPEYWVRGGMSSRSVHRNINYLKNCAQKKVIDSELLR